MKRLPDTRPSDKCVTFYLTTAKLTEASSSRKNSVRLASHVYTAVLVDIKELVVPHSKFSLLSPPYHTCSLFHLSTSTPWSTTNWFILTCAVVRNLLDWFFNTKVSLSKISASSVKNGPNTNQVNIKIEWINLGVFVFYNIELDLTRDTFWTSSSSRSGW